jgi:hypothetical protein
VDSACVVFAVWTLCCHAAVALGASLRALVAGFAALAAAASLAWLARRRARGPRAFGAPMAFGARMAFGAPAALGAPAAAGPGPGGSPRRALLALRAAGLAAGLGLSVWLPHQLVAFWWAALLLLAAAAAGCVLREPARAEAPAAGRALEAGLLLLALACAALALVANRVDLDDAFYVNLATAAVDAPAAPLLAGDTLHGVPGLPLHLPVYRLHGWELWNAALAWVTGIPALACFHFVGAALGAALVPLALARLCRWLAPRCWPWAVAACVFVLLAAGEPHRWYGNFALVRIWQGKGLLLFVFLPLVQAHAIEFALRPGRGAWLRLAAAQIAALGCSSSALWLAPAAALSAAACALPLSRRGAGRLLLLAAASAYLLCAGLAARQWMAADPALEPLALRTPEVEAMRELRQLPEESRHAPGVQLDLSLLLVAGDGRLRPLLLLALVAAWTLAPAGLGRRFAILVPLAALVVLLDPYTTEWLGANVTGPSTWRALWLVPVPLLLALMLVSPLAVGSLARPLRGLAALAACVGFAWLVPAPFGLAAENQVRFAFPPRLKVPPEALRWAQLVSERAGPGSVVVAPVDVSAWLPTLHRHAQPLVVRPLYLARYAEALGAGDLELRLFMTAFVSGDAQEPQAPPRFAEGLERFGVRAVLLQEFAAAPRARAVLRAAGFARDLKGADYEIWLRPAASSGGAAATSSSRDSSRATPTAAS